MPTNLVTRLSHEELVSAHLPLVQQVVAEVMGRVPRHVGRDELVSAALFGLFQAARTFDPERGVRFDRHARSRMRGAVLDDLRARDWATRSTRARARRLRAVDEELTKMFGRAPTATEAAEHMGISSGQLAQLEDDVHRATVLSYEFVSSTTDESDAFVSVDADPELVVLEHERTSQIKAAVASLAPRMRAVVVGWFFEGRRLADIAVDLGVTESRACQMKNEALVQLRRRLAANSGGFDSRPLAAAAS